MSQASRYKLKKKLSSRNVDRLGQKLLSTCMLDTTDLISRHAIYDTRKILSFSILVENESCQTTAARKIALMHLRGQNTC